MEQRCARRQERLLPRRGQLHEGHPSAARVAQQARLHPLLGRRDGYRPDRQRPSRRGTSRRVRGFHVRADRLPALRRAEPAVGDRQQRASARRASDGGRHQHLRRTVPRRRSDRHRALAHRGQPLRLAGRVRASEKRIPRASRARGGRPHRRPSGPFAERHGDRRHAHARHGGLGARPFPGSGRGTGIGLRTDLRWTIRDCGTARPIRSCTT